jgi:hypothetical protein
MELDITNQLITVMVASCLIYNLGKAITEVFICILKAFIK